MHVVVFKFREIWPTEYWHNHALFTGPIKKNSAASQTVATAQIAPKICQGQPPTMYSQCSRFYPNWFTFGGVIAECVTTIFCPVEYFQDRLFEPIIMYSANICCYYYSSDNCVLPGVQLCWRVCAHNRRCRCYQLPDWCRSWSVWPSGCCWQSQQLQRDCVQRRWLTASCSWKSRQACTLLWYGSCRW